MLRRFGLFGGRDVQVVRAARRGRRGTQQNFLSVGEKGDAGGGEAAPTAGRPVAGDLGGVGTRLHGDAEGAFAVGDGRRGALMAVRMIIGAWLRGNFKPGITNAQDGRAKNANHVRFARLAAADPFAAEVVGTPRGERLGEKEERKEGEGREVVVTRGQGVEGSMRRG